MVSGAVTGSATTTGGAVALNGLTHATDVDTSDTLTIVNVPNTLPAGVTYNDAGVFSLDPGNQAYQSLASGASTTVTVNYNVSDGHSTTPASVSWTVTNSALPSYFASASEITLGAPAISGSVSPGTPKAGYYVYLAAGSYVFQEYGHASTGQQHSSDTSLLGDTYLEFYDSSGTLLASDDDTHGAKGYYVKSGSTYTPDHLFTYDSQISYTITTPGTYYLGAFALNHSLSGGFYIEAFALPPDPPLPPVSEDTVNPAGQTINEMLSRTDVAEIAVLGNSTPVSYGAWQYSLDQGKNWIAIDHSVSETHALLLDKNATLRFLSAPDWNGVPDSLWIGLSQTYLGDSGSIADLTSLGGSQALTMELVSTSVAPVNDAPVATGAASLPSVENAANPLGATVSNLFSANFSDAADAVAGGTSADTLAAIAIVGDTASHDQGVWQYSGDHGATWTDIGATVSDTSALVLNSTDELRFLPSQGYEGTPGALTARLIESGGDNLVTGGVLDLSGAGAVGGSSHVSAGTVAITTSVVSTGPELVSDHAIGFDGTTHVDVAATAALRPTSALTIEAWVQLSTPGGSIIDDLSDNAGYRLGVDGSGHLQFVIGDGSTSTTLTASGGNLADGGWHQVAASYDGFSSTLHLFADNNNVGDFSNLSANALGASTFADIVLGKGMNGALNDVRLWSTANTQIQTAHDMSHTLIGSETGLIGYWKFDEQSGDVFANSAMGSSYGPGTSSTIPSFIDLVTQTSSANIIATMNSSSYKGMILASSPKGDNLSYSVDNNGLPDHGSVTFNNNAFVYSPASGHITQDDHFTIDITDNSAHTMSSHTMTIHPI